MTPLDNVPGWSAAVLALANTAWLWVRTNAEKKSRDADTADDPEDGAARGRLARKLRLQESRLIDMESRIAAQDIRLDGLEQDLGQILTRMERTFSAMERRFDELRGWIRDLRERRGLATSPDGDGKPQ